MRDLCVTYHKYGISYVDIPTKLNLNPSIISRFLKKYEANKNYRKDKISGRKRKIDDRTEKRILRVVEKNSKYFY